MYATAVLWLTSAVVVLPSPTSLGEALTSLQGGDLVLVHHPQTIPLMKTVIAIRVMVSVEKVRAALGVPSTFQAAIPTFRRIEILPPATKLGNLEVAWELEIPLWNLKGQLRWNPTVDGVELVLHHGDLAPGKFRISAFGESAHSTIMVLESIANVKDANWMVRRIVRRLSLGEPAIAVAASYVLLKALALYLEQGRCQRSIASMSPASLTSLNSRVLVHSAHKLIHGKTMVATVVHRQDGRLNRVEAVFPLATTPEKIAKQTPTIAMFRALPGWKDTIIETDQLSECRDPRAQCFVVDSHLPFFDMDTTWKVWGPPFRARAISDTLSGAVMAWDVVPDGRGALLFLSQSLGLHQSGYVARKLIAGEPLLEQGLALARILVDVVSLAQMLDEPQVTPSH